MTADDLFEKMDELGISLILDPDWNPSLGSEKWMAIQNMEYDQGFMGSEDTGWIDGDGFTGKRSARGATAREALENLWEEL